MVKKIIFSGVLLLLILSIVLWRNFIVNRQLPVEVATESEFQENTEEESSGSKNGDGSLETEQDDSDTETEEGIHIEFAFPAEGMRPYAVLIDNEGTRSLPQGGLDKAHIIYELIVEGGETRLMPVFWGTEPEMIGPVRSIRHYFLDYAMEHDAIFVHYGWSPMAITDISKFKISNVNGVGYGGEVFWKLTNDRNNWQDSYTSMKNLLSFIDKAKYRTNTENKFFLSYSTSEYVPASEHKAEIVNLRYSGAYNCGYIFDDETKVYKRLRKGQPQMERVSGNQLEAKNIIIQYVENYTIKGDDADRQELKTVGSGSGYFITLGKSIKINWSKEARNSQTRYTDESGNPIVLNPGQTWIQIMPVQGTVLIE